MLSTLLALSTLLTYSIFMHLLNNSALLLTLVHYAFLQYTQKAMANVPFHTLHLLSGAIFLSYPKLRICSFFQFRPKNLSVSAIQLNNWCVCVCCLLYTSDAADDC